MKNYSLSEFNTLVKSTLENHLEPSYWIVAEIGEINVHSKGHCYLELVEKDANTFKAKLRATIWSYSFATIHRQFINATGSPLKSGMKILVNATLQFHELYGLNLNIKDIDSNFTIGERERKREETIKRLELEQLMDKNGSIELPFVPQKIAIISSETAAGYGDFINQILHNEWGYHIQTHLFPAAMQGDAAVGSIIESLQLINDHSDAFDLCVIIRGGGAKTDLDCFDSYDMCVAVSQMDIPVIAGIGHERDQTIVDLVAHTSLKTPTAVAEFIINGLLQFENNINQLREQIRRSSRLVLSEYKSRLQQIGDAIVRLPKHRIELEKLKLNAIQKLTFAMDPKRLLEKGYSITRINGKILKGKLRPKQGDQIQTTTASHIINSTITSLT